MATGLLSHPADDLGKQFDLDHTDVGPVAVDDDRLAGR